ncbi:MAG TPA: DUF6088 family protein [Oligoflexia bacterium]|nr:DUF6088 family protein [Oligoflexia bacterium]HMR24615.1 DUF6088 family protein [Oligoflexia bacterium]
MRKSLKKRIFEKIKRSKKRVFLRKNFAALGDYDQVGRALRELMDEKKLIRLGYGLYVKTRKNIYTGQIMIDGAFEEIAIEALERLKVDWEYGSLIQDYQKGSEQIPARLDVIINDRFQRKIGVDRYQLYIEK